MSLETLGPRPPFIGTLEAMLEAMPGMERLGHLT